MTIGLRDGTFVERNELASAVDENIAGHSELVTVDDLFAEEGEVNLIALEMKGDWDAEVTYAIGDGVKHEGNLYVAIKTGLNKTPSGSPTYWKMGAEKGDQGDQGEEGPEGDKGPTGDTGEKGAKGDTGEKGAKGDTGEKGDQGDKGDQGEEGQEGPAGKGEEGKQGPKGNKGDIGETGPKGDTGPEGAASTVPGPKGDTGEKGAKGDTGPEGAASTVPGPKGDTGEKGAKGDTGEKGAKGDTGEKGAASTVPGPEGEKGAKGDTGEKGAKGDTGEKGAKGVSEFYYVHTWTIPDTVAVPSGDTNFIPPFFIMLKEGETAEIVKARHIINSGTSATVKLQKNGSDITGWTGIEAKTTAATKSETASLADTDRIALVVTAVSGSPKNMTFSLVVKKTV